MASNPDLPTLKTVDVAYGAGTAQEWITFRLVKVNEFAGAKAKMDKWQIKTLGYIIATDYSDLSVAEIEQFFKRFLAGHFGRFYGSVDPLMITDALKDYYDERNQQRHRENEQRDAIRRREERENRDSPYKPDFDVAKRVLEELRQNPSG